MRLNELTVGAFKNLQDFHVDFDEGSPYTVIVGENGAGKSNLLEALTCIFRNLDLELEAPFDYRLKYSCRDWDLDIEGGAGAYPNIRRRPIGEDEEYEELTRRQFMEEDENGPLYRPAFVFGYYSGPGQRLASLYSKHRDRYYDWIIRPPERRKKSIPDPNVLRRLFFAENLHGQFALIAFFMESEGDAFEDQRFLREHLLIDGLDSVLFALKDPPWSKRPGGDERFWGAEGEVQEFLDRLYGKAMLPLRLPRRIPTGVGRPRSVENLYLFLPGTAQLERVYAEYGDQYAFFTALESTHLSGLLAEVRTRVRMSPSAGGGEVTYRDLSEGEQQLLLVLGLLKFTARSESLFLLDEPDTHLNPAWSTQYLDFLGRFIPDPQTCHIVMATHDPLVFSSLERSQVRIILRGEAGAVKAEQPLHDPRGLGIPAILASDLFRLPSGGLDSPTVRELTKQRQLSQESDLTQRQEKELRRITKRLNEQGFWKSERDPVLQLFREKFEPRWLDSQGASDLDEEEQLTVEEVRRREAVADQIAAEIAAELAAESSG